MPRALQTVTITFGLVSIPAHLYTATSGSARISFNLLHKCGSRVKQEYRCVEEDKPVARDELVKGYEFEKDRFVIFTKDELKALEEASSEWLTIDQFLPLAKIDPIYFESAYFLGPAKGGSKPYNLLLQSMRKAKKVAVGRWATRGKQYLVAIRPGDDGLILQQLHYADEVRSQKELEIPAADVKQQELDLAQQLIDSISVDEWQPEQFRDDVRARVEAQIEQKIAGREIVAPQPPVTGASSSAQVIDLMDALRASLKQAPAAKRTKAAPVTAAPAPKRAGAARKTGRKVA